MQKNKYASPSGTLPEQSQILTGRAVLKDSYAVIPKGVMTDIVTSQFPNWNATRAWVLARPIPGFCETFNQSIVEVMPGGGSVKPESNPEAECVIFVLEGNPELEIDGKLHQLSEGSYVFIPPKINWKIFNNSRLSTKFHWIRKAYERVEGIDEPEPFVVHENEVFPIPMPNSQGNWSTTRFVDPEDLRHDMHVNIVNLEPGAVIPFMETHVMEHGIYILQGKGVYRLNTDWVEVEAGDFLWLSAFCPQACYAGGPDKFRYLLYKDVNRQIPLKVTGSKL